MALIDKASLLMVPSTYEAGTLYNVLPSGNRAPDSTDQNSGYDQTRADFTFDRGSNAAATRVNADGLIEKYRENLLLQSNQFDTTWLNQLGGTITGGQSGYDGSSDAWLISKDTSSFRSVRQVVSFSGVTTFSVYAKSGTLTNAALRMDTSAGALQIIYDLSAGVVSSVGGVFISNGIEAVSGADGWYRLFVTANVSSGTNVHIYADRDGTTAGNILIQNAQLESGLAATNYLDSGATTAKAGVLIDLPRINYDANGENGALLLEPSRTNVVDYSEYISGHSVLLGANGGTNTITENYTLSPDGVQNAGRIQADITDTTDLLEYSLIRLNGNLLLDSVSNSLSFYAKSLTGVDQDVLVYWNYDKEIITITNDWQRFTFNITPSGGSSVLIGTRGGDPSSSYAAGGDASLDFALWGIQVEQSVSYPTSYIPNHGTSGGVTRAADSCSVTGVSDVIGQTEGTLFAEIDYVNTGTDQNYINISDGTLDNRINVSYNTPLNSFVVFARVGGSTQALMTMATSPSSGIAKIAVAYKLNQYVFYVNGSQIAQDSSALVPTCNSLQIGSFQSFGSEYPVKQALVFKTALTNAELATLTTL